MKTANYWIDKLGLISHPEGGYYAETYRSAGSIPQHGLSNEFGGERNFATAIYFLLEGKDFSSFHRLKADECWHFYAGSGLNIYMIHPNARLELVQLGPDHAMGERFQAVVPAGCWFAAKVNDVGSYALCGCTMAPGFDFDDFELARKEELIRDFPKYEGLIRELCRL